MHLARRDRHAVRRGQRRRDRIEQIGTELRRPAFSLPDRRTRDSRAVTGTIEDGSARLHDLNYA